MSKTTIRKRISLVVVAALTSGVLTSVATSQSASAHSTVVSATAATNTVATTTGTPGRSMFVATELSTSGVAVVGALTADDTVAPSASAKSLGLLTKDSSSGTAQTATALTGAVLSFYSYIGTTATDVSFVASGGTFNTVADTGYDFSGTLTTYVQNQTRNVAVFDVNSATNVAQMWTAPTTAGTYTVSMYVGQTGGTALTTDPTAGVLGARITVTVVAASAGGSYSAAYSTCNTSSVSVVPTGSNADSTSTVTNGNPWYIAFALNDAYNNDLAAGNIVISATNNALLSYANGGSTPTAGTASTIVQYDAGSTDAVVVYQPTANAPLTTTVTISFNGTTVCTKTVSIRGEVAKIVVSDIATQDLSTGDAIANTSWLDDGTGRTGNFRVLATDSAGNIVSTDGIGTFASDSASLAGQTIVTAFSVNNSATSSSSTAAARFSTGTYTCGAVAGELKAAKLKFTNTGSGSVISSDAFALRCADDPYTYTASWDKASYVQGELATLTVKFLDSKGNPANNVGSAGAWTGVQPMLTAVSATGSAPVLDNMGVKTYTFSGGTTTGITAGAYTSIIDFTSLTAVAATKQTPTYKVSTGGDTTTNADVLKSIVALIASINKQIQALQKLILKR